MFRILPSTEGDIYVHGFFTEAQGQPRDQLARLNEDGSLDTAFAPLVFNNSVHAIAVQPDGKLLVFGLFNEYGGTPVPPLVRLNLNGTLDSSFNVDAASFDIPDPDDPLNNIGMSPEVLLIRPNGRIIAISNAFARNPVSILQFLPNGTLDSRFNVDPFSIDNNVDAAALTSDGKLLIAGENVHVQGHGSQFVARLLPNGKVDRSFSAGGGFDRELQSVWVQPHDQKILIGGRFTYVDGKTIPGIARLLPNGRLDPKFSSPFDDDLNLRFIRTDADKRIYIAGNFNLHSGPESEGFARLLENGQLDTSYVPEHAKIEGVWDGFGIITAFAMQPDGKVLLAGAVREDYDASQRELLVRLNQNGTIDTTFSAYVGSASDTAEDLALLSNGNILLVGSFGVVCLDTNGDPVPGFTLEPVLLPDPSLGFSINSVVAASLDRIYLGGSFVTGDLAPVAPGHSNILCVDSNGDWVPAFDATGGFVESGPVLDLALQTDEKVVAVGGFDNYQGRFGRGIARLMPDGSYDPTFNPGLNDTTQPGFTYGAPRQVAVDTRNDIYAAGNMEIYRGKSRLYLAKILGRYLPQKMNLRGRELAVGFNGDYGASISVTLSRSGAFSAKRNSISGNFRFRGTLNAATGKLAATTTPTVGPDLLLDLLLLENDYGGAFVVGELRNDTSAPATGAPIFAHAPFFFARRIQARQYEGFYTSSIRNSDGAPADEEPLGDGFFTLNQKRNGSARVVGRAPDGSPFTFSSFIGPSGFLPVHATFLRNKGLINGDVFIDSFEKVQAVDGSLLVRRVEIPSAKDYPLGYSYEGIVEGGLYLPSSGIPLNLAGTSPNAEMVLEGFPLATALSSDMTVSSTGAITVNSGTFDSPSLKINKRTGLLSGTYLPPNSNGKRRPIRAILINRTNVARGHGVAPDSNGLLRTPRFILGTP